MIPRRMLGFGFALFLMLVILAVIYAQYAVQHQGNPDWVSMPMGGNRAWESRPARPAAETVPLPGTVTPETAADDLIDEALADRDELSSLAEDEMADLEEGN